jgi:hypothetical protein
VREQSVEVRDGASHPEMARHIRNFSILKPPSFLLQHPPQFLLRAHTSAFVLTMAGSNPRKRSASPIEDAQAAKSARVADSSSQDDLEKQLIEYDNLAVYVG